MIIQKRISQITVVVFIFAACSFFSLLQVAKGAQFHHLNLLHQKHVAELKAVHLSALNANKLDVAALKTTLLSIRQLPMECLELANVMDRAIMTLIGTQIAIRLCEEEIVTTTDMLETLNRYNNRELELADFKSAFVDTLRIYDENSLHFEKPIEKTVNVIVNVSYLSFALLSALLITAFTLIMRSISKAVTLLEENARALEKSEALNRKLARFDTLTGLANRNYLLENIENNIQQAAQNNTELAMLFVDLDHFKDVNDSMGHSAGDELIRLAADRILSCVRDGDTVVRIGGDEFIVLLRGLNCGKVAKKISGKILKRIASSFCIKEQDTFITASIGIALYPHDTDNADDLQKYADLAMYHAKSKGKNTAEYYSNDIEQTVSARIQMAQFLRVALEREEFELHFQPVVRLTDMRIVGAEALLRWNQPELGVVSPDVFIPRAEETGCIVAIGDWVLKEACLQGKQWYDRNNGHFSIAINVSPVQLSSGEFVTSVKNALEQSALPASALDIEITENLMIDETDQSIATLHDLSSLGVRLLLDDFGTGHSSLSYLHKLPFDVLKIDRSFILKLRRDSGSKNITSSIIAMAHELNLNVIAEGVELEESLELLQELHCAYAQGYLFSQPVPAEEIDCLKVYLPNEEGDVGRKAA